MLNDKARYLSFRADKGVGEGQEEKKESRIMVRLRGNCKRAK